MKLFVVDPALKDLRGHHYALTANISHNCRALGHNVICLVNQSLTRQTDDDLYFVRCFSSDTYDGHMKPVAQVAKSAAEQPRNAEAPTRAAEPPPNSEPRSLLFRIKHGCVLIYRLLPVSIREVTTPFIHRLRGRQPAMASPIQTPQRNATQKDPNGTTAPTQPSDPVSELMRSLRNHSAGPEDVVLFHTSDAHTYRDIVELFVRAVRVEDWDKLPQFHLSTPYDGSTMPHNLKHPPFNQSVRRLSKLGLIGTRVFLRAEHSLLAEHLSEALAADVSTLPIPPLTDLPAPERDAGDDSIHVMYLGAARTEKGFPTLPPAIRAILDRSPRMNIRFYIQITPQILGYTPDVLKAVEALKDIEDDRLVLLESPLSQANYQQLLANADVMLLNYVPDRYRFRGSGIAVESVLSTTSVIAPTGTFPAFIAGESGVATEFPEGIEEAIRHIYENIDEFRAKAAKRKAWYLSEHSAEKFVSVLQPESTCSRVHTDTPSTRYVDQTEWEPLL